MTMAELNAQSEKIRKQVEQEAQEQAELVARFQAMTHDELCVYIASLTMSLRRVTKLAVKADSHFTRY